MMSRRRLRTAVILAAVLTGGVASGEEASTLHITARVRGESVLPEPFTVRLRSSGDVGMSPEVTAQNGRATVTQSAGTEWEISVASPPYWTPPRHVTFAPAGEAMDVELELWPTGEVTGVVTAADAPKPKSIALVVESPPHPGKPPEIGRGTKFECPVDDGGRWTCALPAARLDLVLRSTGMTPHYRWDVAVKPGAKTDLGTFRLRAGASFVAYLDRNIAQRMVAARKPARARLLHPVAAMASETAARLRVPVAEGTFDARGWVQLAPLPAGSYVLEVVAEGFAPARIAPVEIYDGKESSFRKLIELFPPIQVSVAIQPPSDPGGTPWRVSWFPLGDFAQDESSVVALTDPLGVATIADQAPGLFSVDIEDAGRNRVWSSDVRVDDERDARVSVDLHLVAVKGNVLLGEEPLSAELWFGGRDGAVRTRMQSSDDGAFEGRLPRNGPWRVEVASSAIRSILDVEVKSGDDILLQVPDTSIAGWVVKEHGERLTRGSVTVLVAGRAVQTKLDEKGEFRLAGLPEGAVQLIAQEHSTGDSSAFVTVQLLQGKPREGIELRIEPRRSVKGTVVSGGQPVVGASVSALTPDVPGITQEVVSDLAGNFSAAIAPSARRLLFIVAAPNRTLQPFEVMMSDQPVVLDVARVGGTLEIRLGDAASFRLVRNGVMIPLPSIFSWLFAHGIVVRDTAQLTVPNLAPGVYRVCGPAGKCADGTLAPGSTLRLDVPP